MARGLFVEEMEGGIVRLELVDVSGREVGSTPSRFH